MYNLADKCNLNSVVAGSVTINLMEKFLIQFKINSKYINLNKEQMVLFKIPAFPRNKITLIEIDQDNENLLTRTQ